MKERDLNALAARVHEANKQWWIDLQTGAPLDRNMDEMLMLVVSEFAEAMEGHRKNLMDDKLPHRVMAEVELADAYIRLLDIAGAKGIDLNEGHRYLFRWSTNFAENLLKLVRKVTDTHTHLTMNVLYGVYGILELCTHLDFDLDGAFEEKMLYNATRRDHSREGRLEPNGKKY